MKSLTQFLLVALVSTGAVVASGQGNPTPVKTATCPVDIPPGARIVRAAVGGCGGGMAGDGWEGGGQHPTTIFWKTGIGMSHLGVGQRTAIIQGLQAWANVVQITFVEIPVGGQERCLDFDFHLGDHSAWEPQEAGNSNCPFDGPGGTLAHAGFPPGVNSLCVGPMEEPFAGNVHFDAAETWELDGGDATAFSFAHVACHEIGHAIGLVHSSCSSDVMRPSTSSADTFTGLSANDIANIQAGYASGQGAVITLNDLGIWVNREFTGTHLGTQAKPFDTILRGVTSVPRNTTGVILHVLAGSYPETLTIGSSIVIEAENGPVTIGR